MKILLQRVSEASVSIDGETVGQVGRGYMALVGCRQDDLPEDADRLALRTAALRLFPDDAGHMNRSLQDINGAVLAISQFTLYADTHKGNRPSFVAAGDPAAARILYDRYVADLRTLLGPERVATGRFGADMQVALVNDGPVTIELLSEAARRPEGTAPLPRPQLPKPHIELIRVTTPELLARVRAIAEAAWPPTYAGIIPPEQIPYMISRMYSADAVAAAAAAHTLYFLVLADGADAGLLSYDETPREDGACELHKIYTLPQYWGRGIGNDLLLRAIDAARHAGASSIWLRVNKNNKRALKAYRRAGLSQWRSICTDIGEGFLMDDYVYGLALRPDAPPPNLPTSVHFH
jgi:D-tyrosyl-tRNA(Tyr) deacylase